MAADRMYLWEWEHVFHGWVERKVREALLGIGCDSEMEFHCFQVGVPVEMGLDTPVQLHPEECGYIQPDFVDLGNLIAEREDATPNIFIASPHHMELFNERRRPQAVEDAVMSVVREREDGKRAFCAFPVRVGELWIVTVVRVSDSNCVAYPESPTPPYDEYRCGLQDFVIQEILRESYKELSGPARRDGHFEGVSVDEIIRLSASRVVNALCMHSGVDDCSFESLNLISAESYEGAATRAHLVIGRGLPTIVSFNEHIGLSETRMARKLLEMAGEGTALICEEDGLAGLAMRTSLNEKNHEELVEVSFGGRNQWSLCFAGVQMMEVKLGKASLPRKRMKRETFADHVTRLFGGVSSGEVDLLWGFALAAMKQHHGTILAISANAAEEAARLGSQCILIEPLTLSAELVRPVSGIDGALLVDPTGKCHALGVILDGTVSENGTPERGARFNSAVRYVDTQRRQNQPALAVIISEDGFVSLYPELRGRIARPSLTEAIDTLEQIVADTSRPIESDHMSKTLNFLNIHRFYLLEDDCDRLNAFRPRLVKRVNDERWKRIEGTAMAALPWDVAEFSPDLEMNDDFYLPE